MESDDEQSGDDALVRGDSIAWGDSNDVMGPTPQKHGRFLGLFDCLSPEEQVSSTRDPASLTATSPGRTGKRKAHDTDGLDTPRTKKRSTRTHVPSPAKTPTVLKRRTLALAHHEYDEDDDNDDDKARPRLLFTQLPKRGLSVLISELRQMEDEDEDEGMNVLREMESFGYPFNGTGTTHDGSNQVDFNDEGGGEVDVQGAGEVEDTSKVKWKKKGLKRSHRRVIMRPQARKKASAVAPAPGTGTADRTNCDAGGLGGNEAGISDDEYINSEDEAAADIAAAGRPLVPSTGKTTKGAHAQVDMHDIKHSSGAAAQTQAQAQGKPQKRSGGGKKPAVVSQNYKSLKLRNSGAKGGNRFGRSRFGGRR